MGLGDFLGGKTKTYKKDALANDINSAGKIGLSTMTGAMNDLNSKVYDNADNFVQNQIDAENKMLRGSANDSNRRLSQILAQRGIQNSSMGIGEQLNNERQLNDKIALNRASSGSRLKDLLAEKMNAGQTLYGVKTGANAAGIQMQDIKQKQGGMLPLLTAGLGAYMGGAPGAQVGLGLGQYLNS